MLIIVSAFLSGRLHWKPEKKSSHVSASFCMEAAGKIKEADYILVHHQNSVYENAAEEMDELLGITHTALRSVRCREGTYKCIKGEKR